MYLIFLYLVPFTLLAVFNILIFRLSHMIIYIVHNCHLILNHYHQMHPPFQWTSNCDLFRQNHHHSRHHHQYHPKNHQNHYVLFPREVRRANKIRAQLSRNQKREIGFRQSSFSFYNLHLPSFHPFLQIDSVKFIYFMGFRLIISFIISIFLVFITISSVCIKSSSRTGNYALLCCHCLLLLQLPGCCC